MFNSDYTPLLILIVTAIVSKILDAVKDTLHHHWINSVFARFGQYSFFGQADVVWLRKYVDFDPNKPKKWWADWLDGVADMWHLCKSLEYAAWIGAMTALIGYYERSNVLAFWHYGVLAWVLGMVTFNLWYLYLLKHKT